MLFIGLFEVLLISGWRDVAVWVDMEERKGASFKPKVFFR